MAPAVWLIRCVALLSCFRSFFVFHQPYRPIRYRFYLRILGPQPTGWNPISGQNHNRFGGRWTPFYEGGMRFL